MGPGSRRRLPEVALASNYRPIMGVLEVPSVDLEVPCLPDCLRPGDGPRCRRYRWNGLSPRGRQHWYFRPSAMATSGCLKTCRWATPSRSANPGRRERDSRLMRRRLSIKPTPRCSKTPVTRLLPWSPVTRFTLSGMRLSDSSSLRHSTQPMSDHN